MEQRVDLHILAKVFKEKLPEVEFAYLFGSAQNGLVKPGSDLDIAFYLEKKSSLNSELILKINSIFSSLYPELTLDISFLNEASLILQFEALKGKRLFVRNQFLDQYTDFFSQVARRYEDEIARRAQQLKYRGYS